MMGNQQAQRAKNSAIASKPPTQPSASKVRGSSASKVSASADVESLKKSKTYYSKVGGEAGSQLKYDEYKLTRAPHFKEVVKEVREEDYLVESNQVRKSQIAGEIHSLSFKMDDPNGVSEQAHIYTFDYERSLNHFINWSGKERTDGRSSVLARQ